MEEIERFIPVLVPTLSALSLILHCKLRQARKSKLEAEQKARQDLSNTLADCDARLGEIQAEADRNLEMAEAGHAKVLERYAGIIDIEAEIRQLQTVRQSEADRARDKISNLNKEADAVKCDILELRSEYREKRALYDRLKGELAIFDERLAFAEMGVYEPHFDFGDSKAFQAAIKNVRNEQKDMVKQKVAVFSTTEWRVNGSKKKGETMTGRAIRITLRAFNNECDAAIANTRWNNINAMEKRITRAREAIDKLNASNKIEISENYFQSKLTELYLTYEYQEQLKTERDERSEALKLEREERRLLREADAAQKEEEHYQKLLEKARAESGVVSSEAHQAKVEELQKLLEQAHAQRERVQAMAEKTKSGFVYVISNVGSFGDDVVKIGLTRRLDPSDRVRELGDASVPFLFDTHAMIYSEEAPALEAALHAEFSERRVNAANMRKEFFRVSLSEVEEAVRRLAPEADFHTDIEAQEFYETLSKRKEIAERLSKEDSSELPLEI